MGTNNNSDDDDDVELVIEVEAVVGYLFICLFVYIQLILFGEFFMLV